MPPCALIREQAVAGARGIARAMGGLPSGSWRVRLSIDRACSAFRGCRRPVRQSSLGERAFARSQGAPPSGPRPRQGTCATRPFGCRRLRRAGFDPFATWRRMAAQYRAPMPPSHGPVRSPRGSPMRGCGALGHGRARECRLGSGPRCESGRISCSGREGRPRPPLRCRRTRATRPRLWVRPSSGMGA